MRTLLARQPTAGISAVNFALSGSLRGKKMRLLLDKPQVHVSTFKIDLHIGPVLITGMQRLAFFGTGLGIILLAFEFNVPVNKRFVYRIGDGRQNDPGMSARHFNTESE